MEGFPSVETLNLEMRGAVVGLLVLVAAALWAARRRSARLGAVFALGAAAYAVCSAAGFHARAGFWSAPFLALAVGNNLVFWLFARSLFDDGFRLKPAYGAAWVALALLGVVGGLGLAPGPLQGPLGMALAVQALAFAGLAVGQTLSSWGMDLVEPRRRLRAFVVAASAGHIALTALAGVSTRVDGAPWVRLADAVVLGAIAATVALAVMRHSADALLAGAAGSNSRVRAVAAVAAADPAELELLRRLEREMTVHRAYREDGLSIGVLAQRLGAPEYRLRRAINQRLGRRNFAAFLNSYRLADAKDALGDPAQADVPILTIALDAGFGSLGPFNRAFRADTGVTPTEYRRAALDAPEFAVGSAA